MIVCPACHAENPDGTKICVKCGTELPKVAVGAGKAKPTEDKNQKFGIKDLGKDLVEGLWLLLIIALVLIGFWGELTHWTMHLTETEEAKMIQEPVLASKPVHPRHVGRHASQTEPMVKTPISPVAEQPPVELGSPDTFYEKSKKLYDGQHYQESFAYLKKALEIDPTYAKAYFALGYLYGRFEMDDASVRMYEMSLHFDPTNPEAMNNLGMRYYHAGNYDDALDLFQKAVALDNQNADYQYDLGSVYLDMNNPNDALTAFQKAAEIHPSDPEIYDDMAVAYEKLGKKQEALDTWQKVMQYSSDSDLTQNAKTHIDFLQSQS
jgi:tetratricopeptide (TPR) repeat protein